MDDILSRARSEEQEKGIRQRLIEIVESKVPDTVEHLLDLIQPELIDR